MDNRILEFVLELLRALIVDEMSGHVRRQVRRLVNVGNGHNYHRVIRNIHQRTRSRLFHRLYTERDEDP